MLLLCNKLERHGRIPRLRLDKASVEARACAGVAGDAVSGDIDDQPDDVLIAIGPDFGDVQEVSAFLAFFQSFCRERLQKWAMPVSRVRCSASAFMWANIKISPVARSLAMAGIKPSLANFGRNVVVFSISSGLPEHVDGVEGALPFLVFRGD